MDEHKHQAGRHQVTTINKATRMLSRIGTMAQSDFKLVENGVKEALGFAVS